MHDSRRIPFWIPLLLAWLATPTVHADRAGGLGTTRLRELKRLQQEILLAGGARARVKVEAALRAAGSRVDRRGLPRAALARLASRPPRDLHEAGRPPGPAGVPFRGESAVQGRAVQPANVLVSDPLADRSLASTQSEVSVAVHGRRLVAVWNDGEIRDGLPGGIGYGYSADGGRTWTDGGTPPRAGGVALWVSDPVLAADEKSGDFYLAAMVITDASRSGLAVVRGRFDGGSFAWESPRVARATRDTFPDKPWLAADSLTGRLYLSYTSFFRIGDRGADQIEFQRSPDGNRSWTPAVRLSSDEETGLVQGSRPALGPRGELYVVWKTIDTTLAARGRDVIRLRTSLDGGQSFGPPLRVAEVFTNFCSGAPGFNRGFGLGFPSIAVDRGAGPRRGRIYVAWEEPLDFYDDALGTGPEVGEVEPNGGRASATPFELGETLRGAIGSRGEIDWFRFPGVQGQTAIVYLDSMERSLDVALRLSCGDGLTQLAYSAPQVVRPRVIVYTLPVTGDYFVRVAPHADSIGTYRIATGLGVRGSERGRDHRDVFATWSDDGLVWSDPVRVNDDPPWFDAWLPEIATSAEGRPYLLWYDWRDADPSTCGGASHVYLARSDDAGASWVSLGPVTRVQTAWSAVSSNLSPNQGDYLGLVADGRALHTLWADGRDGDPNVYGAVWPLGSTARDVEGLEPELGPGGPRLAWRSPDAIPLVADVHRRTAWAGWTSLRTLSSDAAGVLAFTDATAQAGLRYQYRLGVRTADGEVAAGELAVEIPDSAPARLAIERIQPNPTAGPIRIWFRRPTTAAALLEVLDLGGRRRLLRAVGEEYGRRGLVELDRDAGLPPGLYVVRLTQAGRAVHAKVVVLR